MRKNYCRGSNLISDCLFSAYIAYNKMSLSLIYREPESSLSMRKP